MTISLHLTSTAHHALQEVVAQCELVSPVITIVRAFSLANKDLGWSVAVCEREKLGAEEIFKIDEFDFYIDDQWLSDVAGRTLDFRKGKFLLSDIRAK